MVCPIPYSDHNKRSAAAEWPGRQPMLSHLLLLLIKLLTRQERCPNYCPMVPVLFRHLSDYPVVFLLLDNSRIANLQTG